MSTRTNETRNLANLLTCLLTLSVLVMPASLASAEEPVLLTESRTVEPVEVLTLIESGNANLRGEATFILNKDEGPRPREDLDDALLVRLAIGEAAASGDDSQARITARYQDQKMLKYLSTASSQQITQLFYEASTLIDTRHVNPLSYEERTRAAVGGLIKAVENTAFLTANRVSANNQSIRDLQAELANLAQSQPARTLTDSLGVLQWAQELSSRRVGLRREAVALEFFNATIDALDKYSAFMPGDSPFATGSVEPVFQTASLNENIVGIGVELKAHDRGALVSDVIEGGPAEAMQLRSGDIIIAVNMKSVAGQSLGAIADQIGGPAGSTVTLDVERDGRKYRGTARRQKVYVSSVSGTKMLDANSKVGYVRMKQFSSSTAEDLEKALWTLHRQGMKSLVLDLRGNPGGLLDESIQVTDLFLPCGTIVSTRGRTSADNTSESAKFEKTWSTPLVVLVDNNSASASEIFAAAIQENGRGVVVGRQSYGKGTVQTHFPLKSTNGLLKLTTAKFYSPAGREMAGTGVVPDFAVNIQSVGFRGTADDPDVIRAMQVIAQGTPAQLAAQATRCNPPQAGSLFNSLTGTSGGMNLGNTLQAPVSPVRNFSQELFGIPPMNANWQER